MGREKRKQPILNLDHFCCEREMRTKNVIIFLDFFKKYARMCRNTRYTGKKRIHKTTFAWSSRGYRGNVYALVKKKFQNVHRAPAWCRKYNCHIYRLYILEKLV